MIDLIARVKVQVTPPSDFPFADQLRVLTAVLFFIAFVITARVAWDSWKDLRGTDRASEAVHLTAELTFREEVLRGIQAFLFFIITTIRVFLPGPVPSLSAVTSILLAVAALLMTLTSVLVNRYRQLVLRTVRPWNGRERRKKEG